MFDTMHLIINKKESLRIVYYHMIAENSPEYYFEGKSIGIKTFKKHLKFYKDKFDVISLKDAISSWEQGESLNRKLVITFDDGFRENHSVIAPILLDENLTATFFIISNCIDNMDMMWRNKLILIDKYKGENFNSIANNVSSEFNIPKIQYKQNLMDWSFKTWPMDIKEPIVNNLWSQIMPMSISEYLNQNKPYCSVKEIKELVNDKFEVGSHSMSHPLFSKLDYDQFKKEIINSSDKLSEIINCKINHFSYPFGIRADNAFEQKFFSTQKDNWRFFGIKNKMQNYGKNLNIWERDNSEFSYGKMLLRFHLLPVYRLFKG